MVNGQYSLVVLYDVYNIHNIYNILYHQDFTNLHNILDRMSQINNNIDK